MSTEIARVERRPSTKDLTGNVFGILAVEAFAGYAQDDGQRRPVWRCRCACGEIVEVWAYKLQQGKTRSCGCGRSGRGTAALSLPAPAADSLSVREEAARAAFWREREARRRAVAPPMELYIPWMA